MNLTGWLLILWWSALSNPAPMDPPAVEVGPGPLRRISYCAPAYDDSEMRP